MLCFIYNYSLKHFAIHAGKSLKLSDDLRVMETNTFSSEVHPNYVKVNNGCEFIGKIFDK